MKLTTEKSLSLPNIQEIWALKKFITIRGLTVRAKGISHVAENMHGITELAILTPSGYLTWKIYTCILQYQCIENGKQLIRLKTTQEAAEFGIYCILPN